MAGITSTKKIKGQPHLLAYITPNEVEKLKALGGQETMTAEGIPAYPERDNYGLVVTQILIQETYLNLMILMYEEKEEILMDQNKIE